MMISCTFGFQAGYSVSNGASRTYGTVTRVTQVKNQIWGQESFQGKWLCRLTGKDGV